MSIVWSKVMLLVLLLTLGGGAMAHDPFPICTPFTCREPGTCCVAGMCQWCGFPIPCGASRPCGYGMCCGKVSFCGYTDSYCSPENCASQCPSPPPPPTPPSPPPPPPSPPPPSPSPPPPSPPPPSPPLPSPPPPSPSPPPLSPSPPPPSPPPPTPSSPPPPVPQEQCGWQTGGAICPGGLCCSNWGFCGDTEAYCNPDNCQSNCWLSPSPPTPPPPPAPLPQAQCGWEAGGALCPEGLCCSNWGFCGDTEAYCGPGSCQSQCSEIDQQIFTQ